MIMTRLGSRSGIVVMAALLALVGLAVVAVATGRANPKGATLAGVEIPADQLKALVEGARSCPTLTPARLAGQVMEQSQFDTGAAGGVAGLSSKDWKTWRPWEGAERSDPRAGILALAHLTCDLVGRVRSSGSTDDLWLPAVAAVHAGVGTVLAAKGVPDAERDFTDRVNEYARWYETHGQFDALGAAPEPTMPTTPPAAAGASPTPPKPTTEPKADTGGPKVEPPSNRGIFKNDEYHGCLSANAAKDGTKLSVAACDGSAVQRWTILKDGTIRSVGLCMDAANASTENFTPVQVAYCSGNPAQQFRVNAQQHIYSPYANKCVNVHLTKDQGPKIVLYSCLNQGNQKFVFERR
jgi:hypothetical protein